MRERFQSRRWRSRLIIAVMVVALLGLSGAALYIYFAYQGAAVDAVLERDRQSTYLSAARLRDELTQFSEELVSLARTRAIYNNDAVLQSAELRDAANRLLIFDGGVVLLDNFGRVRAVEPPHPELQGDDWSDRPFFRDLVTNREDLNLARPFFSDALDTGIGDAKVVAVSVPIVGENNEFVGALAGMFTLGEQQTSALYASIVRLRRELNGNTYVVDSTGKIIYNSGDLGIGEPLDLPSGIAQFHQGGLMRTRNSQGQDVVFASAPVPDTGWTLILEKEWSAAISTVRRYAISLLVLLAIGIALPIVGVGLLVREQRGALLEKERNEQEARAAALITKRLVADHLPLLPGWSVAVHHRPAPASESYFRDVLPLPDGRLILAVAHVAEKGITAAYVMTTVRTVLRGAASLFDRPADALRHANEQLCAETDTEKGIACALALLEPATGRLQLANAGFNSPCFYGGGNLVELQPQCPPLGLAWETHYEQCEVTVQPGECLVLHGEGLLNAQNSGGQVFDLPRVKSILTRQTDNAEEIVEHLVQEFKAFSGRKGPREEDLIIIVLAHLRESGSNSALATSEKTRTIAQLA